MGEVTELLSDLVAGAAKYATSNHDTGLERAAVKLVLALKSDGLIEDSDARSYESVMGELVESRALRLRPSNHVFVVCGSRPFPDGL